MDFVDEVQLCKRAPEEASKCGGIRGCRALRDETADGGDGTQGGCRWGEVNVDIGCNGCL